MRQSKRNRYRQETDSCMTENKHIKPFAITPTVFQCLIPILHSGVARKQANKSKGFVTNPKRYINNGTAGNGVKKTTLIVHILQLYTYFFLYKITHRHHRNVCIHVY
jgi:hypothetical protein